MSTVEIDVGKSDVGRENARKRSFPSYNGDPQEIARKAAFEYQYLYGELSQVNINLG